MIISYQLRVSFFFFLVHLCILPCLIWMFCWLFRFIWPFFPFTCFQSVIVKSVERNAVGMYRARQTLLGQKCESCGLHLKNGSSSNTIQQLPTVGMSPIGKKVVIDKRHRQYCAGTPWRRNEKEDVFCRHFGLKICWKSCTVNELYKSPGNPQKWCFV